MIVYRTSTLDVSAEQAWHALKLRDTFLFITRGVMSYRGSESWPELLMSPGVEICTVVYPFGFLPGSVHTFKIVSVDDTAREIKTKEHGGLIRTWNHTMKIAPVSDLCCRYYDRIEIDAGALTVPMWSFAQFFYRYRQRRWQILAADLVNRSANEHQRSQDG